MTTALKGLVQKLNLKGQELGEVSLGAVNKHSYDFALARECVMDSGLSHILRLLIYKRLVGLH
jgi:acetyl-CoA C-acetyltransferase